MTRSAPFEFIIIISTVLFGLLCPVGAQIETNVMTDVETVLSSSHGINWASGEFVRQAVERMKTTNTDKYLAAIDASMKIGTEFTNRPVNAEEL